MGAASAGYRPHEIRGMTLMDWALIAKGYEKAHDASKAGANAPDIETHNWLIEKYGKQ